MAQTAPPKSPQDMTFDELIDASDGYVRMLKVLRMLTAATQQTGVLMIDGKQCKLVSGKVPIQLTPEFMGMLNMAMGDGLRAMERTLIERVDVVVDLLKARPTPPAPAPATNGEVIAP
jgi:tRNA isopentenyl-2-thiomethyl-A-37 hydroxylase MiaE